MKAPPLSPSRAPSLSLKGRALRYLAAREHSRLELTRKLGPHAESSEQLEQVLNDLEQRGLLCAERFAQSVVYRKASKHGMARVKAELAQHNLPDDVVRAASQALRESEFQRAHAIWLRRFGHVAQTPDEKARQMRFLAGRGFAGDVIRRVLRGDAPDD